jgi:hypothetical protein
MDEEVAWRERRRGGKQLQDGRQIQMKTDRSRIR